MQQITELKNTNEEKETTLKLLENVTMKGMISHAPQ